ncbi:hypothetical protein H9L15_05180 [Sphingomonas daechungensis]|uniref:Replication protein n=1 Tax=Sphingomonas daechungensis TaxID=1176646 RepID=A0ABX6T2B0_9SPHN|nr:hypothetical protein [Sphingomonas daechungensis]QNP43991.1 hypothetical protein H9L15_05180 [Sphingomonas daechungensis]
MLNFDPVVRKVRRPDGWTPELQRELIARIAATGTVQSAVWQMGKHATGSEALYKTPSANGFRMSWDAAIIIGRRRNGLDSQPPYTGEVPGIQRRGSKRDLPPEPAPEPVMSDEQKWDLMQAIGAKFLKKVAAERQARLAGQTVAADFYLRQVTFIEVMFDLTATRLGFDTHDVMSKLRRGDHDVTQIASTAFSDWLDAARRKWWTEEGQPERPRHPDVSFLKAHRSVEGKFTTAADEDSTGATTTPARGFTRERWATMKHNEQRAARQWQYGQDAEEQRAYERRAIEEWRARVSTERSDADA